ncbi:CAP domain-containing protein [Actimicrobium antarcticum]|uniref:SCP domain-containing protein n=1 Tax=Actimicrobium antarcticum TaxID=1051899 RepID=A0ABP7T2N9_9BURK
MSRINQVRASGRSCGGTGYAAVAALSWNDKLLAAAALHSADMAARNYFSHTGSDGSKGGERMTRAGYSWRVWAENIAAGQTSVSQAMQSWLDSPSHCAALMGPSAVEVGVSCTRNDAGAYKYYWTMEFGTPS